jgi:nucleotide-binding universal stress UspA family protein
MKWLLRTFNWTTPEGMTGKRDANVKRILMPTDFSESAECALPHTLEMARRFDAHVYLLHVRSLFSDDPNQPEFQFFNEGGYEEYVEGCLSELLHGVETSQRVDTATIRRLSAASGILEFAQENQIDQIVMGTHGRSALFHFLLGSVAEKVVRHARCPVLTVANHRDGYRDRPEYRRILAAFDFSEQSKEAVRRGQLFAEAYQAELVVLHVIEQLIHPAYSDMWKVTARSETPEVIESARVSLSKLLGTEGLEHPTIQVQIGDADGKAEREIIDYAAEHEFDLIIMGTHGLSGLNRALMGSTTERVVRTAPCPVLTFHGTGELEAAP